MPVTKLRDFLDVHRVKYVTIVHSPAFTAQEAAASAHISGKDVAKTVIVLLDGRLAMAVLPATRRIDFARLEDVSGAERVYLAREADFKDVFPGCELGAMPPFGNLFGLEVFVDRSLAEHDEMIAFNAGFHTELMQLRYDDFVGLVEPRVCDFVVPRRDFRGSAY